MTQRFSRRHLTLAVAWLALLIGVGAAVGGCSGGDATSPTAPPTTGSGGASPSSSPEEEAKQKVLAVYDGYREAYIAATAVSDLNNVDLPKYVADPLLTQARFTLNRASEQGIVYKGRPTWKAMITSIDLVGKPVKAVIEECLDTNGWDAVYKATGKSAAAPGQSKRYIVNATAYRYDDGRWLIAEAKADRSRPC